MKKRSEKDLNEYAEGISKKIRDEFENIRRCTSAPNTKGLEGETILKSFLERYYSNLFDLFLRRSVLDKMKNETPEYDIVLTSKMVLPQGIMDTEHALLFVESVKAAIEVKFTLDRSNLKKSLPKLKDLKELKVKTGSGMFSGRQDPLTIIFAYDTDLTLDEIEHECISFYEAEKVEETKMPDMIVILDKGLLIRFPNQTEKGYFGMNSGQKTLFSFLTLLTNSIGTSTIVKVDLSDYFPFLKGNGEERK